MKFGQNHCTIVQGLLSDFGATLKIHKNLNLIGINSNFLRNISTCTFICNYASENIIKFRIFSLPSIDVILVASALHFNFINLKMRMERVFTKYKL